MTVITEIDPIDLAEIFGQIGGFWDLILIFWPILFVAASYDPPHLKPRNFRKSAERVKETLTEVFPTSLRALTGSKAETKSRRQLDAKDGVLSTCEKETASSRHQKVQARHRGIHLLVLHDEIMTQIPLLESFNRNILKCFFVRSNMKCPLASRIVFCTPIQSSNTRKTSCSSAC